MYYALTCFICLLSASGTGTWLVNGLDVNGKSQFNQPVSTNNAIQAFVTTNLKLPEEWSADKEQDIKTQKRRHEPRDISSLPVGSAKVAQEFSGLYPTGDLIPAAFNKPYFEDTWPTNVSVVLGHPASLKCRTRLLGDKMVWICDF